MHTSSAEQAIHSIRQVHDLIHQVFTDHHGQGLAAIEQLMPVFAEDFSMVTTTGASVGRDQVEQMFRGAVGARAGLQIHLSEWRCVWQQPQVAAIRYRETHRLGNSLTSRLSLAIIGLDQGSAQWLYLHETSCPPLPETPF